MENICMLCAVPFPYNKEKLIKMKGDCFHKSCLKRIIKYEYDNLTDDEIDFLIDTEIKEYKNYSQ